MSDSIPEFVDRILEEPFESPAALDHRLESVDEEAVRAELVERIEEGGLETADVEVVVDMLASVGLDEESYRRLFGLATADEVDSESRRAAFMALVSSEDFDAMELVDRLGPETMDELMAANLSMLMQHAEQVPEVAFELAAQLLEVSGPRRRQLFEMMEQTRDRLGLDAGLVYAGLFGDVDYQQLWPMLVEAVQKDGVAGDAQMLDDAAARATDADIERELRQAAMQLRTRGIEEESEHRGFGLFGSCDGTGGYPIVVARERPDGSMDVINLLFRTTGEFRDAVIFDVDDREELDEIAGRMQQQAGADFIEISLPRAAALVDRRLEEARRIEEGELPSQFDLASQRIRRLTDAREEIPEVEPADELPDRQRCEELFDHSRYDFWYLDRATFVEARLDEPPEEGAAEAWYDEAVEKLAKLDYFIERTASLGDHMALWHRLAGDDRAASQLAAVAEATREEPESSPLVRIRLQKTLEEWSRQEPGEDFPVELIEDPDLRRSLRQRFFTDIETPRGSHVVHLTLTCVVFVILDWSLSAVAAEHQPRPDVRYNLAYQIARNILSQLTRAGAPDPEQLHEVIAGTLAESTFDRRDADHVAALILQDTQRYLDEFASSTFYEALGSPEREMADAFYD